MFPNMCSSDLDTEEGIRYSSHKAFCLVENEICVQISKKKIESYYNICVTISLVSGLL